MVEDEKWVDSIGNTFTCKNGMLFFTPPLSEYTPTVIAGEPQYWFTDLGTTPISYNPPTPPSPPTTSVLTEPTPSPNTPASTGDNNMLLIGGIAVVGIIGIAAYLIINKNKKSDVLGLPIG